MSVVAEVQHAIMVFEQRYSKISQYVVLYSKHREYNFKGNLCFYYQGRGNGGFYFLLLPLSSFL